MDMRIYAKGTRERLGDLLYELNERVDVHVRKVEYSENYQFCGRRGIAVIVIWVYDMVVDFNIFRDVKYRYLEISVSTNGAAVYEKKRYSTDIVAVHSGKKGSPYRRGHPFSDNGHIVNKEGDSSTDLSLDEFKVGSYETMEMYEERVYGISIE